MNRKQFEKKYKINLKEVVYVDMNADIPALLLNFDNEKIITFGCYKHEYIDYIVSVKVYNDILNLVKEVFIDCSQNSYHDYFFINPDKMRYIFYNDCKTTIYTYQSGYENNFFRNNEQLKEKYKYFYNKNGMYIYFNNYNDFEFKKDENDFISISSTIEKEVFLDTIFYWEEDYIKDFQKYIENLKLANKINNF